MSMDFKRYGGRFTFRFGSAFAEYIELRGLILWLGFLLAVFTYMPEIMLWVALLFGTAFVSEFLPRMSFAVLFLFAYVVGIALLYNLDLYHFLFFDEQAFDDYYGESAAIAAYNFIVSIVALIGLKKALNRRKLKKLGLIHSMN